MGAPVFGTGPSPPFLDVCYMTANCHVTNFTDEDRWSRSKSLLLKLRFKLPKINLLIPKTLALVSEL